MSPTPAQKKKRIRKAAKRAGLALLKSFEGLRLEAYKAVPSETYWTIGYGHYGSDVKSGQKITAARAEQLLLGDLKEAREAIDRLVKVKINPFQRWALISFAYNAGVGALEDSTLLRKLNEGHKRAVPRQLMRWVHAGGAVLEGLVRRRRAEGNLWRRHPKRRRKKR